MEKLYFENYDFNDIKDSLHNAIKNLNDTQSFFNIFCHAIRNFTEVCLNFKISLKNEKKLRDSVYDNLGAIVEIEMLDSDDKNSDHQDKVPEIKFKNFSKHSNIFNEIIRDLFEHYRVIEIISHKIEKVLNYFLSCYCDKYEDKNKVFKFNGHINFFFQAQTQLLGAS